MTTTMPNLVVVMTKRGRNGSEGGRQNEAERGMPSTLVTGVGGAIFTPYRGNGKMEHPRRYKQDVEALDGLLV